MSPLPRNQNGHPRNRRHELRGLRLGRRKIATTAQLFAAPAAPDEKFTTHELRELQSQLRAAEAKLATSGLPEAAIRELTAAIRDTAAKAETMSKKNWLIIFVGTIVTAISGLSPEHVQTVYQTLKATFTGWLLH